ncbi:MAG TPA: 50S ribosomal protein L21 [Actinomycetota bacterium]|nr:50S ribosomal protein L21 [Actinomycetota bacterium]
MYAVIKTGGKQQKVKPGDVIEVERIVHEGDVVSFPPLLVVDEDGETHYGKEIEKAVVTAEPLGEKKGDKVKVFTYRPKTGYQRRGGHRQTYTLLEIKEISLGAVKKAAARKTAGAESEVAEEAPAEGVSE